MHQPESVQENETPKILRDFEIQTNHSILARRTDLLLINKKRNCHLGDFVIAADHQEKIKESRRVKYVDLARKLKNESNSESSPEDQVQC